MNFRESVASLFLALLASSLPVNVAHAQGDTRPLDLRIALGNHFPTPSADGIANFWATPIAIAPADSTAIPDPINSANTSSGKTSDDVRADADARLVSREPYPQSENCDAADNKVQVHGSVDVGVVAGSQGSGNHQSANVNITKFFGDCDEPRARLSITLHYSQSRFRSSRADQ